MLTLELNWKNSIALATPSGHKIQLSLVSMRTDGVAIGIHTHRDVAVHRLTSNEQINTIVLESEMVRPLFWVLKWMDFSVAPGTGVWYDTHKQKLVLRNEIDLRRSHQLVHFGKALKDENGYLLIELSFLFQPNLNPPEKLPGQ